MTTQTPPLPPTEDELHAWVDGQLPPGRAAEVTHWLGQSPDDAAKVRAWQQQRRALQALGARLLEESVPQAMRETIQPRRPFPWQQAWVASLLLTLGFAGGWVSHTKAPVQTVATAPAFVREAQAAHVVYTPDQRHPVEVGAKEETHLIQWLSRRLGTPLKAPHLESEGFSLIGGRLLSGEDNQPRALFMYENSHGERITLHVSARPADQGTAKSAAPDTAFQFNRVQDTETFYWVDQRLGYALSGNLPRTQLAQIAAHVYPQLLP